MTFWLDYEASLRQIFRVLVNTAKRMAMNRMKANDEALPPLIWEDFEHALERTQSSRA